MLRAVLSIFNDTIWADRTESTDPHITCKQSWVLWTLQTVVFSISNNTGWVERTDWTDLTSLILTHQASMFLVNNIQCCVWTRWQCSHFVLILVETEGLNWQNGQTMTHEAQTLAVEIIHCMKEQTSHQYVMAVCRRIIWLVKHWFKAGTHTHTHT